jgi:hypothetical protein
MEIYLGSLDWWLVRRLLEEEWRWWWLFVWWEEEWRWHLLFVWGRLIGGWWEGYWKKNCDGGGCSAGGLAKKIVWRLLCVWGPLSVGGKGEGYLLKEVYSKEDGGGCGCWFWVLGGAGALDGDVCSKEYRGGCDCSFGTLGGWWEFEDSWWLVGGLLEEGW